MAPRPAACLHRLPFAALLALACTARQDAIEPPPLPEELREPRVLLSSLAFEGLRSRIEAARAAARPATELR